MQGRFAIYLWYEVTYHPRTLQRLGTHATFCHVLQCSPGFIKTVLLGNRRRNKNLMGLQGIQFSHFRSSLVRVLSIEQNLMESGKNELNRKAIPGSF